MNPMPLTEEQREELAHMLEQALAALGGDIESERQEARDNVAARRDSGVQDRGEESFAGSVVEVDRALLRQHEVERREVQAALVRLREGSYGECVKCGDPVGYERLRITPAAGRCLRCQELAEEG